MPSDITGTSVLNLKTNDFEFRPGPLFTQVLLADEINRATPKTQAALLEAMQERQVTVDGETHPLPDPFFVLATQNPIELEGTFPLPEAQLDRFLLRVKLGYPDEREELRILQTQPAERTRRGSRSPTGRRCESSGTRSRRSVWSSRCGPTWSPSRARPATIRNCRSARAPRRRADGRRRAGVRDARRTRLRPARRREDARRTRSATGSSRPPTRGSATGTPTRSFARSCAPSPCPPSSTPRESPRTRRNGARSRSTSRASWVFAVAWGEMVVLLWASAIAAISIASTLWARRRSAA